MYGQVRILDVQPNLTMKTKHLIKELKSLASSMPSNELDEFLSKCANRLKKLQDFKKKVEKLKQEEGCYSTNNNVCVSIPENPRIEEH